MKKNPTKWKTGANVTGSKRSGSSFERDALGKESSSRSQKRKREGPSKEALELSSKLKEFSKRKQLKPALELFWSKANDSVRDAHHACILIDCCSRCGDCEEGERVAERLKKAGRKLNVEANTALLKGYAHSGEIEKAMGLFEAMCTTKAKSDRPNIRSLNTVLRGCLWSAATVQKNGGIAGGVSSSEKAWQLFGKCRSEDANARFIYDTSAYEASIALLCQALRVQDAEERLELFKSDFLTSVDELSVDQSVFETLAVAQLSLARACALLALTKKSKSYCREAIKSVAKSKQLLEADGSSKDGDPKRNFGGGKRGWKHQSSEGETENQNAENRRSESNTLYRSHKLDSIESDAKDLLESFHKQIDTIQSRQLARRLLTRLLVLSGGGTTSLSALGGTSNNTTPEGMKDRARSVQHALVNSTYASYGLEAVMKELDVSFGVSSTALKRKECNRVLGMVGLQGGIVKEDGLLDFEKIFSTGLTDGKAKKKSSKKKYAPVDIELGAGFGEWIVNQASENPNRNHVAVELRADRVGQIFARTAICSGTTNLENLCVVGGEATDFLASYVRAESISTIFINHPEPPTQTFGAEQENLGHIMKGGEEPAHMLNSRMFEEAIKCLSSEAGGKIVVVTDNRWYGKLICATLSRVMSQNSGTIHDLDLSESMSAIETFGEEKEAVVRLYEGSPGESIGHSISGGRTGISYFDRLWRTGAGRHSERRTRYVIAVSKS